MGECKQTALIIGASSGIGRELAKVLAGEGYRLCVTARRVELLESLAQEIGSDTLVRPMDLLDPDAARTTFAEIAGEMQGLDLVVISAGTGFLDPEFTWEKEDATIAVNVRGFAALAHAAYHLFLQQGRGHLVGISSLAAIRGGVVASYNASKAFVANYLQGLRYKAAKAGSPMVVTEACPGFVDTAMAQGEGLFWVQPAEKAARQIADAIRAKKTFVYVTKRWRPIAWLLRSLPDALYHRM